MRHSIYLKLAVLFIKADLHHEDRVWRTKVRRAISEIPLGNAYLLRDIGLNAEGRPLCGSAPHSVTAKRRVRHLRRAFRLKIAT